MSQSTITISSTAYNLNIIDYNETEEPLLTEKTTIIDPSDYDADNSILVANGRRKHVFTVNGWCTIAHRAIYVAALRNSTKVYPVIYPGAGSTNIIETNAYYYIRALTGNFQKGNDTFWFDITFIYGGS